MTATMNDADLENKKVAKPLRRKSALKRIRPGDIPVIIALVVLFIVTVFPFYWSLRTALSSNASLAKYSKQFLPHDVSLDGFKRALGIASTKEALAAGGSGAKINFLRALRNSMILSTMVTVGQVTCCSMAAYAFARLKFRGRNFLFFLILGALMVPPIFILLPNFIFVKDRGWLNSYLGMAAPTLLMTPFAVFFLRQFLLGISREVEEAALIDGAGRFRIFAQVVMPMAASPIATLAVLTFIQTWNDYLWPKLVGPDDNVRVLTASLGNFKSQTPQGSPDWSGLMAATWVSALPIIILLLVTGKRVVNSIQFSGIK
jgi:multiple sugar transport system permease protein